MQDLFTQFRIAEKIWLQQTSQRLDRDNVLQLQDCHHYGELGFLLAGLKPMVVFQLPSKELTKHYYDQVLIPRLFQHASFEQYHLAYKLITRPLTTVDMDLQGCCLVWSPALVDTLGSASESSESTQVARNEVQQVMNILTQDQQSLLSTQQQQQEEPISERSIAILLDYPGSLPETEKQMQEMIEVVYWDVTLAKGEQENNNPVIVTLFAAQPDQVPGIKQHFTRYKNSVKEKFGLELKISIRNMAE